MLYNFSQNVYMHNTIMYIHVVQFILIMMIIKMVHDLQLSSITLTNVIIILV